MRFLLSAQKLGLAGGLALSLISMMTAVRLAMHGAFRLQLLSLPRNLLFSSMLVFAFGWAITCAGLARKRKWESRTCDSFALFSYFGLALLPFFLVHQIWSGAELCIFVAPCFRTLSRKIAFPHLKLERQPEPLISLHLSR